MKVTLKNIFLISSLILLTNCDEDEITSRPYPRLKTLPVTNISEGGAMFNAEIISGEDLEVIEYGFVWGKQENPVINTSEVKSFSEALTSSKFSLELKTTLDSDSIYYVRAFVRTSEYIVYGINTEFLSQGSIPPSIENFEPKNGTLGSEVEIAGSNFDQGLKKLSVALVTENSETEVEIDSISTNYIRVTIPYDSDSKEIRFKIIWKGFESQTVDAFVIDDPSLNSFSPQIAKTNDEVEIIGNNFSPVKDNNEVLIDGYPAEIISSSLHKLVIRIPDQSDVIYSDRDLSVSINVFGTEASIQDELHITDKWLRLNDLPFGSYVWKGLTINNEGYVLFRNGLWKYNHLTNTWSELTPFPDETRGGPGIFSISNKIYLGAGSNSVSRNNKDFWEYDISSDTWTQKGDFPGEHRTGPLAFSIGTNGYMGAGAESKFASCCSGYNDVWQYDSNLDTWSVIPDYPLSTAEFRGYWRMVSTELNNEVYVGLGTSAIQGSTNNEVYKYSEISNEWIRIEDYPRHAQFSHIDGVAFTVDNQAFFGSGEYPDVLWSYDGSSWNSQESGSRVGRNGGFSFVINNIAFLGGGEVGNQFWLFDSSQPD